MDMAGVTCEYQLVALPSLQLQVGADWVVFEPSARIPEVWSRMVLTFHYFDAAEGAKSEVHATVTRHDARWSISALQNKSGGRKGKPRRIIILCRDSIHTFVGFAGRLV